MARYDADARNRTWYGSGGFEDGDSDVEFGYSAGGNYGGRSMGGARGGRSPGYDSSSRPGSRPRGARYGGDFDRGMRYDADLVRRYAQQARGRSTQHQHAGGWMRGYDRESYSGYGPGGRYGASMYGGGRYGEDYLGAWAPGGWGAEHGREHSGVRNPGRYGRDFRDVRG